MVAEPVTSAEVLTLEQRLRHLLDGGPGFVIGAEHPLPDSVALGVYTSGSTGSPKLVGLTRENLLRSARASLSRLSAQTGATWSVKLPLHHIAGVQVITRSIVNEGVLVSGHADYTSIVPTQLVQALDGAPLIEELQYAKAVLLGGGRIDPDVLDQAAKNGINIITTYGMTETAGGCVYDGLPLDEVEIALDDQRIKIRGPLVAAGYFNNDRAHHEHFVNGWFLTQDRGHFDKGRLVIDGRIDDIIISGGENISLTDVEQTLIKHPKVKDVICFGVPDRTWGELLVAAVVASDSLTLEELREFMQGRRFAAPRKLMLLQQLPRTELGKPDRTQLRKMNS